MIEIPKDNRPRVGYAFSIVVVLLILIVLVIFVVLEVAKLNGLNLGNSLGDLGSIINGIAMPIIALTTAAFAYLAFDTQRNQLSQQEEQLEEHQKQLKEQKMDIMNQRIEDKFFQLLKIHQSIISQLEYKDHKEDEMVAGSGFFEQAYNDLIDYFNQEKGFRKLSLEKSVNKLDDDYKNNFHLYYKNIFNLFKWIEQQYPNISKEHQQSYIDLIRAQLSYNQMMLIYFNATYFGNKGEFYRVLERLDFLNKYNLDGYKDIESKFEADAAKRKKESDNQAISEDRDDLLYAIQHRELEVDYQPIVSSWRKQIKTVEALIRWRHPEKGILYPEQFIDDLDHHYATRFLEYLLRYVCDDSRSNEKDLTYSINVSLNQLLSADFLDMTESIRNEYGVETRNIQFELTESKELYNQKEIKKVIKEIQDAGYKIGMDDFGVGFFSFHDLIDLNLDFIKLDKELVAKLSENHEPNATIEHLLQIMRLQGLDIIVEGIETMVQFNIWREKDVDGLQGFFISKAVPNTELRYIQSIVNLNMNDA